MAFVVVGGAQVPFIITIPSFPFNCFFSLAVFKSGKLQMNVWGYYNGSSISHLLGHSSQL